MAASLIGSLFGRKSTPDTPKRERLVFASRPAAIYAIGDIHGMLKPLLRLEARMIADAQAIEGEKWFVYLGDYIDRGPASAAVLDHLLGPPPPGIRRLCLAGNHEEIALGFLDRGEYGNGWLDFGGRETLHSYGVHDPARAPKSLARQLAACIPSDHLDFLKHLPAMISMPGLCFVHAGIDPGKPLDAQDDAVLMWSRPKDFPWPEQGLGIRVVHGHTPVASIDLSGERINVDLGAYAGGTLGALKIDAGLGLSVVLSD